MQTNLGLPLAGIIKSKIQMCEKIGRFKEIIWILFLIQNNPVNVGSSGDMDSSDWPRNKPARDASL